MSIFNKSKGIVGLDIGSSSIKLVGLKPTKVGYELTNFRMAPLPPDVIVDGAIIDSAVVADAIREIIAQENIKTKDVVTSISGNSVIVKKIKLPMMTEEELEESIQWEAEQYIPFDINDVNLDVQILDLNATESEVGQMDVILWLPKKTLSMSTLLSSMKPDLNLKLWMWMCSRSKTCFKLATQGMKMKLWHWSISEPTPSM
jgi:type IV pilus assembly protein PilM